MAFWCYKQYYVGDLPNCTRVRVLKSHLRNQVREVGMSYSRGASSLRESDIMLASFPRSGNTWVMNLLLHLGILVLEGYFHDLRIDKAVDIPDEPSEYIPALKELKYILQEREVRHRVIKTHEMYQPGFPRSIYMIRDGRDVMVSYYFFRKRFHSFKGNFLDFLVMSPSPASEWADHVESWLSAKDADILFLRYENLLTNPLEAVTAALDFLGERRSVLEIQKAVYNCSFQKLSSHELAVRPAAKSDPNLRFFRKGIMGEWKYVFGPEHIGKFKQEANWMLLKLGYANSVDWYSVGGKECVE